MSAAPCGTPAAYKRHLRRNEVPCGTCRAAWAGHQNGRRISYPLAGYECGDCGGHATTDGGYITPHHDPECPRLKRLQAVRAANALTE